MKKSATETTETIQQKWK